MIRWSYDTVADALYFTLAAGDVDSTVELSSSVFVDVDADGHSLGIEVLAVRSANFKLELLADHIENPTDLIALIHVARAAKSNALAQSGVSTHHIGSSVNPREVVSSNSLAAVA